MKHRHRNFSCESCIYVTWTSIVNSAKAAMCCKNFHLEPFKDVASERW